MKKYFVYYKRIVIILISILVLLYLLGVMPPTVGHKSINPMVLTKINLSLFYRGLQEYKKDTKDFPSSEYGLNALLVNLGDHANWSGPYVKQAFSDKLEDYWGSPLMYQYPNVCGFTTEEFLLYSKGENKIDECGNGDDILATEESR